MAAGTCTWVTIETAAERYQVGTDRLLDYARRGNLPLRRAQSGETLVDEAVVAAFFRSRRPEIMRVPQPQGPHLGILGLQRLGQSPDTRDGRRRAAANDATERAALEAGMRKATA